MGHFRAYVFVVISMFSGGAMTLAFRYHTIEEVDTTLGNGVITAYSGRVIPVNSLF